MLQRVAMCCSVLQCVAVCCSKKIVAAQRKLSRYMYSCNQCAQISMLQCAALRCSVLQCAAVYSSVLQCVAECCSVLQCVALSVLQCAAVCCNVLQYIALCCSVSLKEAYHYIYFLIIDMQQNLCFSV